MKQIKPIHLVYSGATMLGVSVYTVAMNIMPLSFLPNDIITIVGTLLLVIAYSNFERIAK